MHPTAFVIAVSALGLSFACGGDGGGAGDTSGGEIRPAKLVIDQPSVSFGALVEGGASPATALVIGNDGDLGSGLPTLALTGPDADAFSVVHTTCRAALAPHAACVVRIAFRPRRAGAASATLELGADPGGSVSAALDGEGIAPAALSLGVSAGDLGVAVVGTTASARATFSVSNGGQLETGPLRVSGGAAGFTLDDGCQGRTLAAGASCAIEVAFAPVSVGPKTLVLAIDALPGGHVSGSVRGVGLAPARLEATPSLSLGSVVVGATGRGEVVVENVGQGPSGPLTIALGGPGAFSTAGCDGVTLGAGEACTVAVAFSPDALGARSAQLSVRAEPGGEAFTALTGTGITSRLAIAPSEGAFAPAVVGTTSTVRFTLSNKGTRPSGLVAAHFEGPDAARFALGAEDCSGASLAPGARCTLDVAFSPASRGAATAELVVTSPDGGAATAALEGVGLAPAELALSATALDFGAIAVGFATPTQELVVENVGDEPSGLPAFELSGPGAAAFTIVSDNCYTRLQPGHRCHVDLRLEPHEIALAAATITASASPGGTVTATLDGEGVDPDQLRIAPASVDFPELFLGDRAERTFVVTNDSAAPTGQIAILKSGAAAGEYLLSEDCVALAPHASCTIVATFEPHQAGLRSATLRVSASPGGAVSATLSGVGVARLLLGADDGTPLTGPLDFGGVIVGTTVPRELAVTVTNQTPSAAPLTVTANLPTPSLSLVASTCGATLAAGAHCSVRLSFLPTRRGDYDGTVRFAIGDGPFESVTLTVIGTGLDALSIAPEAGTDFGWVPRNTTSDPLRFRVTNAPGTPTTGRLVVRLEGPGMQIVDDACGTRRLAASETCTFGATFSPTQNGDVAGLLTVSATPGGQPALALDGRGVDPVGAVPTAVKLTPSSVLENQPVGTTVGTLTTVDADHGQTYRYALLMGGTAFSLADATIKTRLVFDRELTPTQSIRVLVTDSGGQMLQQDITITIANVDEPTVLADDAKGILEDANATTIDVLANDVDPDTALLITAVTQPAVGSVAIRQDKRALVYTPKPNACNTPPGTALDTFSYTVNNAASANVRVAVWCVDDPGIAVNDTATATEGGPAMAIPVLANDIDVDGNNTIASVTQPDEGTVVITGGGTGLTYQPAALPTKTSDVFTYTLRGGSVGTVTVTVTITTTGCQRLAPADCVHGTCVDGGTLTAICVCDDGWDGTRCDADVDECLTGDDDCDAHATCRNTLGGWLCTCNPGWSGDGVSCADVDECAAARSPCAFGADCGNTQGGFSCACADGFAFDAVADTCIDVDECATANGGCTGAGVDCINGPGAFDCAYTLACSVCTCAQGYEEGPAGGCFDIDECARGSVAVPRDATCINTAGGWTYTCPAGTEIAGDESACLDLDECLAGTLLCGAHETCVNDYGSAHCECASGYRPEGAGCADVDECALADFPCYPTGTCDNTAGGYACTCPGGLVGDGVQCGTPAASAGACGANATFVGAAPSHCQCNVGYFGDGLTCTVQRVSTGVDGPFAPSDDVWLAPGVYHFTTIDIPAGVTVLTYGDGVLELRATGDVDVAGAIDLSGESARIGSRSCATGTPDPPFAGRTGRGTAGEAGSGSSLGDYPRGGDDGGGGGAVGDALAAFRAGGGGGGYAGGGAGVDGDHCGALFGRGAGSPMTSPCEGGAGPGPYAGGDGGVITLDLGGGITVDLHGAGGGGIGADAAADLTVRTTFRPGSGGGGGTVHTATLSGGLCGGGGGGALLVSSPTSIVVTGSLRAQGGGGRAMPGLPYLAGASGGGSGGVIYLVAPSMALHGQVLARGGGVINAAGGPVSGGAGGLGRIRLSVVPNLCVADGTLDPPLAGGCAASPPGGTAGYTYVGTWPE